MGSSGINAVHGDQNSIRASNQLKQYEILTSTSFCRCRRRGQEGPTTSPSPTFGPFDRVHRGDLERLVLWSCLQGRLGQQVRQQCRPYGAQLQPWRTTLWPLRREPTSPWWPRA